MSELVHAHVLANNILSGLTAVASLYKYYPHHSNL